MKNSNKGAMQIICAHALGNRCFWHGKLALIYTALQLQIAFL